MRLAALFSKHAGRRIGSREFFGQGAKDAGASTREKPLIASGVVRILSALALTTVAFLVAAQTINYTYDEAGRLKSVTNTANETAEYVYDAAGNLTQIRRTAANVPAVTDFRPDSGPVGTVVTISGANFSATPASNTVRFNGTLAAVSSASTTQLDTTVPAGATTGLVSVQTSAGTGTSFQSFTVTASGAVGAPTITSFTPGVGLPGAAVTISGTNFATAPGQTKVYFNQSLAPIQSITTSSIVALVPAATGSGRIRVVTASGVATSTADFVIPPQDQTLWPIGEFSGPATRLVVGGSGSLNMTPPANANRWGMYVFEGGGNAVVTLDFTSLSTPPNNAAVEWEIRNVRNESMTGSRYEDPNNYSRNLGPYKRSIHVPPMALDGTYAVLIRVGNPAVSTFSSTVLLRPDVEAVIDGALVNFSTSFVGQTLRYFFRGTQGMTLGQALQGLVITPPNGGLSVGFDFRQPDWTTVKSTDGANPLPLACQQAASATHACGVDILALPVNGIHSVILIPPYPYGPTAASGKLWLSNDLTGSLTLNQNFDTPVFRVGQNGRFTFTGTQGQYLGVTVSPVSPVSNVTFAPTDVTVAARVRLFRSNGIELLPVLPGSTVFAGTGRVSGISFPPLPANDTYTLFLDPDSAAGGSARLRLWQAVAGLLAIDGSALPLTLAQGQNARVTFTVPTGGRNLGLGVTGLVYTPVSGETIGLVVRRLADNTTVGTTITACLPSNPFGRCDWNLPNLLAGDYAIEITPASGSAGTPPTSTSLSLTLSADVAPTPKLIPGTSAAISIGRAGQNARLTFDGLIGDKRGLAISGLTVQDGQFLGVSVLRPNGTVITTRNINASTTVIDIPPLDASGVYTIYFDPWFASTITGTFNVLLSSDVTGTLTINGTPQNVTLSGLGQYATFGLTISAAGQNLGVGLSALTIAPASGETVLKLTLPDGTGVPYLSVGCYLGPPINGCALNLNNLAIGQYNIVVSPPDPTTSASFTLTVSTDVTPPKLTLGTPYGLAVARRGQDARLTFGGIATQNRRVTITSFATVPSGQTVTMRVLRPSDGVNYAGTTISGTGATLDLPNQPQTGDYTLWFDQSEGLTYSLTINVTQF